ncbi:uncharacterized protein [Notamacropus eugenii]|uniref:uncharacterized protein isoform X2 n=1 Tax=Notamacropus eugenii TaxID=9315 RepID=UPI003B676DF6
MSRSRSLPEPGPGRTPPRPLLPRPPPLAGPSRRASQARRLAGGRRVPEGVSLPVSLACCLFPFLFGFRKRRVLGVPRLLGGCRRGRGRSSQECAKPGAETGLGEKGRGLGRGGGEGGEGGKGADLCLSPRYDATQPPPAFSRRGTRLPRAQNVELLSPALDYSSQHASRASRSSVRGAGAQSVKTTIKEGLFYGASQQGASTSPTPSPRWSSKGPPQESQATTSG